MLKTRVRIGITLEKELNKKLTELSEATRINRSRLLDEAMIDLFKKYEKKIELYK